MKIAIVVGDFPVYSETFILYQVTGLIDRGHDVTVFANTPRGKNHGVIHEEFSSYDLAGRTHYFPRKPLARLAHITRGFLKIGFQPGRAFQFFVGILKVLKYGRYSFRLMVKAISFLERGEFEVIHSHFGHIGLDVARLKAVGLIRAPTITTFHGADATVKYSGSENFHRYDDLFQTTDLCTVNSCFIMNILRDHGAEENKLIKLQNGVIISKFPYVKKTRGKDEPFRLLTISRLVEFKGTEFAIRAVAKLLDKWPDIRYLIVGDGPLKNSLAELVEASGAGKNIEFLGRKNHNEIIDLYARCHVFLLPSIVGDDGHAEGQGVVLLEAQASGLPVIATNTGGIPENIIHGKTGFLVPERDPAALAEKIEYLLKNEDKLQELGGAGRKHIEQNYDMDKMNDNLVELYQRVKGNYIP